MGTQHNSALMNDKRQAMGGEGRAAGLMALVILLIVVVCASAALMLTVPQAFEAAASASNIEDIAGGSVGELTFHERHPVNVAGESPDSPTF